MQTSLKSTLYSVLTLCLALVVGCASPGSKGKYANERKSQLKGSFGTYSGEPRLPSGRVDVARLVGQLSEIKAQTYSWLIWHKATDWEDLQEFLPLAAQRNIRVWVTLVPPSETPPSSEPFGLDYERWAVELAKLSLRHPNLVAWSIDDFSHNGKVFTAERLRGILEGSRQINPKLAFVPCIYYRHAMKPEFAATYAPLVDGIVFPFRNESVKMDLEHFDTLETEIAGMKKLFGKAPILVVVYATKHSALKDATPEYVREVMSRARKSAEGVMVYCHQSKTDSPEKYKVIEDLFAQWARK